MLHAIKTSPLVAALAALLMIIFGTSRSAAHDLAIDQLTLFPDPAVGRIRGQILFDPDLTRANNDEGLVVIAPRLVAFLEKNLAIEVDGRRVALSFEVRELFVKAGAVAGDSVMLDGSLPRGAKELRVFAGKPLRALAVTIETTAERGRQPPGSALALGGEWTPTYRFATPAENRGWAEGDPQLLAVRVPPELKAPGSTGFVRENAANTVVRYVKLGFAHILPHGWDHVLFVAALVLGSRRRLRSLLVQLAAFTAAHTVTLGLGALGLVVLPGRVVEPLIAFSIAFIALENLLKKDESRHRALWAFAFGLLHGQGFAGALAETGLPRESFLTALFSFNVGVELGQLVVVGVLLLLLHALREPERFQRYAVRPGSVLIATAGLYWAVERLAA